MPAHRSPSGRVAIGQQANLTAGERFPIRPPPRISAAGPCGYGLLRQDFAHGFDALLAFDHGDAAGRLRDIRE